MANVTYEAAANTNSGNVRKALKGFVAIAPYETSAPITTLVAPGGQINLPAGFVSVGLITSDGVTENGKLTTSDIGAWGFSTPVRRDVTGADSTVAFTMEEDTTVTRALYDSVAVAQVMSAAGENVTTGEAQPDIKYWRVLVLGLDGSGSTRRYFATAYHKMSVSDRDDLVSANNKDSAYSRGVTLSSLPDDDLGTLFNRFVFGPGALAHATEEGYTLGS